MDTLYLTNSNLKFSPVVKDRLFYDQYQYCLKFHLDEVSCLKDLNHQHIDIIIARRRQWREIGLQRWNSAQGQSHLVSRRGKEITQQEVDNLHALTDHLLESGADFKLVTSVSYAWIYSNDIKFIEGLNQLDFLRFKQYTQAVIDRPKGTIKLKEPGHKLRSFLRSIKLTGEEKTRIINFLDNQQEIRISPALAQWMGDQWHRTQDYFFIDHDEESWLVMLSLVRPGLVRKTVQLIAG